jgi:ATP-dependent Lhr-like helicase
VLERQHVTDSLMPEALDHVMERLAGCWLPVNVWLDVLSARIQGYAPELLDEWVRDGALCWQGSCSAKGHRLLAFGLDRDIAADCAQSPRQVLDAQKQQLLVFLETRGASFLHQIATGLAQPPSTLAPLLWDLIWDGWVTNDSLDPALGDRPSPELWQHHRRSVRWGKGRWSALAEEAPFTEEHLRRVLRRLLLRYGVLSREILHHAKAGIAWRDAYPLLTRMEWAGDVERALFVSTLSGPQFALVEARRALSEGSTCTDAILVNVNDPANVFGDLFGILRPDGARHIIRHHPGNYLVLADGHPLLAIENRGERLIPLDDLSPSQRAACAACLARLVEGRQRAPSVRVNTWDGNPIANSPIEAELAEAGFVRDGAGMILYRRFD